MKFKNLGFSCRSGDPGHGVGLAVSSETAAALGGSLGIESIEGRGTRATLRLPVGRSEGELV